MRPFSHRNLGRSFRIASCGSTLRAIIALAVLTGAGCATSRHGSNHDGKQTQIEPAPLEEHVALARKQVAEGNAPGVGRVPRKLTPPLDLGPAIQARVTPSNRHHAPAIDNLELLGVSGDEVCVNIAEYLDQHVTTPSAELAAHFEKKLETTGVWLEAVESLDALTGRKPWPPGPTSTRLVSAKVIRDELETIMRDQPSGDGGEPVEVKENKRVLWFLTCGTGFALTPRSNYIIAVVHSPPAAHEGAWDPEAAKRAGPEHTESFRMRHDSLLIWALSDDGKVDLSK